MENEKNNKGEQFMKAKFIFCKRCGKMLAVVKDAKPVISCCGEKMDELIPGTTEAATEKHIPVYKVNGNTVDVVVGEVEHPMVENHYIEWIAISTKQGGQIKFLRPKEEPKATFALADGDELEEVFAYCNIHGLWNKK